MQRNGTHSLPSSPSETHQNPMNNKSKEDLIKSLLDSAKVLPGPSQVQLTRIGQGIRSKSVTRRRKHPLTNPLSIIGKAKSFNLESSASEQPERGEIDAIQMRRQQIYKFENNAESIQEARQKLLNEIKESSKREEPLVPEKPDGYYAVDYKTLKPLASKPEDIEWVESDGKKSIKLATLEKLVEELTSHQSFFGKRK